MAQRPTSLRYRTCSRPALRRRRSSNSPCPVVDRRRRDPHNFAPTLKHVIDGLVDAGLWPDDTPEYVRTLEPALAVRRDRLVRISITPRATA